MPDLTLHAVHAKKGDALVLTWTSADGAPHLAVVDGGPAGIWKNHLLPCLTSLAPKGPPGKKVPVPLDLVVISHVDDDHIKGILDMVGAVAKAHKRAEVPPVTVAEFWHNAFADLAMLPDAATDPDLKLAIAEAVEEPSSVASVGPGEGEIPDGAPAQAVSIGQGRDLDRLLRAEKQKRNTSFSDRGGVARRGSSITVGGLTVSVIAPDQVLLGALEEQWRKELPAILKKEADKKKARSQALALAFDDDSVPNQSSIVLLVEDGTRTLLLTGDARGDHLLDALRRAPGITLPLHLDVFKVPHHGSAHSNTRELFDNVTADQYVISGNGEHGNPHPDVLAALFEARQGHPLTLHLTNMPTAGAVKPEDLAKATRADAVLEAAKADPNVTIVVRDPARDAVSVTV